MAWTITLEDEAGHVVASASKELRVEEIQLSECVLLRYLDAYGNTVFNRLQVDDLIKDLLRLKRARQNPLLEEIIALAEQCREAVHTYVVFTETNSS